MQVGGHLPVLQRERHLDQPGDAGGRLEVADVASSPSRRAADDPAGRPAPSTAPSALQLDRVAERRAGAVRLDVGDLARRDARRVRAPGGPAPPAPARSAR